MRWGQWGRSSVVPGPGARPPYLPLCPALRRWGSGWAARCACRHWPQGLGRAAEVSWLNTRRRRGIAKAPVASSMAAYRKIPRRHRPAVVGRSATVGFGGRDQPGEITPQFAPRSPARRRPRCQSIGRGSQRTHMTPAAMTASRGGGQMQVLVSRVHSDNRVQKGQTHLDGHPAAVSTEVRPAARFGDRRRDGRCACKGARAVCSLDRNRGGHHLQTDTVREWQACRHVPVPCVRLFPTSSTRSETKAAGVGNYAISVSGDTGTSFAELSRSDKRRALAANRLIAQSSQNDPLQTFARTRNRNARHKDGRGTGHHAPRAAQRLTTEGLDRTLRVPSVPTMGEGNEQS